jgi:MarR family transcriptional regulator, lower aerobic nicotinate degradation pathway regulator
METNLSRPRPASKPDSANEGKVPAAPYRRVPAYLIRRLQMISASIFAEAFEGEEMPLSEWAVLTMIDNHPDIDQSRLAEIVSIDRANTGRLVDELASKGMVERHPDDEDRRVWRLRCTRRGVQTRKQLIPRALASQERLLSCLRPKDRKIFIDLMFQLVAANERYIRPGAGRRKRKTQPSENDGD